MSDRRVSPYPSSFPSHHAMRLTSRGLCCSVTSIFRPGRRQPGRPHGPKLSWISLSPACWSLFCVCRRGVLARHRPRWFRWTMLNFRPRPMFLVLELVPPSGGFCLSMVAHRSPDTSSSRKASAARSRTMLSLTNSLSLSLSLSGTFTPMRSSEASSRILSLSACGTVAGMSPQLKSVLLRRLIVSCMVRATRVLALALTISLFSV